MTEEEVDWRQVHPGIMGASPGGLKGGPPPCKCGTERYFQRGVSAKTGKPYAGWFCTNTVDAWPPREPCKPLWIKP